MWRICPQPYNLSECKNESLSGLFPTVLAFLLSSLLHIILVSPSPTWLVFCSFCHVLFPAFSAPFFFKSPSSPSPPPQLATPVFYVHLCSHRAAPLAFSKLLSISLKPMDAMIAINLGETGSHMMPDSPDGVSG